MFLYVLRIVGAMSLVFVIALIVTQKWWFNQTVSRSASFWQTFCLALISGLVLCVVPALLGSSDNDEFIFTDFSEFLAYAGFCTLLITAGVIVYWRHRAKEEVEEVREKNEEKNKDDARAYFALAINYLTKGDIDSALRAYQNVEERDEVLASELYDQIFSRAANQEDCTADFLENDRR